jgi:hypothetical protein
VSNFKDGFFDKGEKLLLLIKACVKGHAEELGDEASGEGSLPTTPDASLRSA